jgi:DNA-binding CsgD family transcriptional regulator
VGVANLVFHAVCISSALGAIVAVAALRRVSPSPGLLSLSLAFLSQLLSYALGVTLIYSGARFPALAGSPGEDLLLTAKFLLQGSAAFWFPAAARGLLALPATRVFRATLAVYAAAAALLAALFWFHPGAGHRTVLIVIGLFSLLTYVASLTYSISLPLRVSSRIAPRYRRVVRGLSIFFLVLVEAMIVQDVAIILGAPLPQGLLDGLSFFGLSLAILVISVDILLSRARVAGLPGWQEFGRERGMTDREIDVLGGLVRGRSYKEIAARFSISLDTVKTHVGRVYRKAGVVSRSQLRYLCKPGDAGPPPG